MTTANDDRITEPTTCEIAEVLEHAVEYIKEHGWTQNAMEGADGSVCALGGIRGALGGLQDDTWWARKWNDPTIVLERRAHTALESHLRCTTEFNGVAGWNDYKGRKSPVGILREMRRVARKLRAEGGC